MRPRFRKHIAAVVALAGLAAAGATIASSVAAAPARHHRHARAKPAAPIQVLSDLAVRAALLSGDSGSVSARAVETTAGAAMSVLSPGFEDPRTADQLAYMEIVTGTFNQPAMPVLPGTHLDSVHTLVLVVNVATGRLMSLSYPVSTPSLSDPRLHAIGQVVVVR
jgi:hypothetical protein